MKDKFTEIPPLHELEQEAKQREATENKEQVSKQAKKDNRAPLTGKEQVPGQQKGTKQGFSS